MKYLLLSVLILGCQASSIEDIQEITVYPLPQGVNYPIDIGDSWIDETEPYVISDSLALSIIENRISKLRPFRKSFDNSNIYLRCYIRSDKREYVLNYNRFGIKIGNRVYSADERLIKLLSHRD